MGKKKEESFGKMIFIHAEDVRGIIPASIILSKNRVRQRLPKKGPANSAIAPEGRRR